MSLPRTYRLIIERRPREYLLWAECTLVRSYTISHNLPGGPYGRAVQDARMIATALAEIYVETYLERPVSHETPADGETVTERCLPDDFESLTPPPETKTMDASLSYHDLRCRTLAELRDHPWLRKVWAKVGQKDIYLIVTWMSERADLEYGAFDVAVQRMHMDTTAEQRPKKWKEIQELLTCLNSAARALHYGSGRIAHKRS